MKPFFGLVNNIILIIIPTIIVIAGLGWVLLENNVAVAECNTPIPEPFCGTVTPELSEEAEEGSYLFKANCVACHKLYKRASGPALKGVADKFPSENNFLIQFIQDENKLSENTLIKYKSSSEALPNYKHKFNMTNEQINQLLEYLK